MIRIEENKLVIEIQHPFPKEAWVDLHSGLCDVLSGVTSENIVDESFFAVVNLLRELTPDTE